MGQRGQRASLQPPLEAQDATCQSVTRSMFLPSSCTSEGNQHSHGTALGMWGEHGMGGGHGRAPSPGQGERRALCPQNVSLGNSQEQMWERDGGEAGQVQAMYQSSWKSIKALQVRQVCQE